ncbi:MAG: hypothetical protein AABX07_04935 [Nanoarchaeota archaeon]
MKYEAQKVGEVPELGTIYRVNAPLDEQLKAFEKVGIRTLATLEEVAQIRLAEVSNDYSRTSIAPIAVKDSKTILVRDSPLMNPLMTLAAVRAHANKRYFETIKEVYEAAEALAQSQDTIAPEDRDALIVSQTGDFKLTPEMDESRFVFRKQTTPYFAKFTEGTIPFWNLFASSKNTATVNYLWFSDPQDESVLSCRDGSLDDDGRAFGVLRTA